MTKQEVRKTANFVCKNCGRTTDCQIAHIIPDSWGGSYKAENLLFLCNPCHRKFEVEHLTPGSKQAKALIRRMKELNKDGTKFDYINACFDFYSSERVFYLGRGFKIVNTPIIFAHKFKSGEILPLLSLQNINERLILSGIFYDCNNNILLEIKENKIFARGSMFWDFKIEHNSGISLFSNDKKVFLTIKQNEDSSLELRGNLYFFGKRYQFEDILIDPNRNSFSGNVISSCGYALIIDETGIVSIG